MFRHTYLALLALGWAAGCSSGPEPILSRVTPLNGSTAVDPSTLPVLEVPDRATLDASNRKVVLYDVTSGAHLTVSGAVEIMGGILTYHPQDPLAANHAFRLEVDRAAISGKELNELDGSEAPEEPLTWPYRLWFSTKSCPRVRSAYLESDVSPPRVVIHFSQPMDPVATGKAIQVLDLTQKPVAAKPVVWRDSSTAQLDLTQALDPATPYSLRVGADAVSDDAIRLDGNDDGAPCGPADDFSVAFTGSQSVIRSRLPKAP